MAFPPIRQALSIPRTFAAAAALGAVALVAPAAHADSPFVDQVPKGVTLDLGPSPGPVFTATTGVPAFTPPPQFTVPHLPNANLATTIEIGNNNKVVQVQTGAGDQSNVGVIGDNNSVGVVQAGNNLQSNFLMIGTAGMGALVLQGPGSAPVNMAIIHVPHGTVIIPHL